jgi:hypothetical protein
MSWKTRSQCFRGHFSEVNDWSPIIAKSTISCPIITIFSPDTDNRMWRMINFNPSPENSLCRLLNPSPDDEKLNPSPIKSNPHQQNSRRWVTHSGGASEMRKGGQFGQTRFEDRQNVYIYNINIHLIIIIVATTHKIDSLRKEDKKTYFFLFIWASLCASS